MNLLDARSLLPVGPLVQAVDELRSGHTRVETSLRYPDGSNIDVFLASEPLFDDAHNIRNVRVTDFGQTTSWLQDAQVEHWSTHHRREAVAQLLALHHTKHSGGEFFTSCEPNERLDSAVLRLAQTCASVAALVFTRRSKHRSRFNVDVERFLEDRDFEYESNIYLPGKQDNEVKVDFLVAGKSYPSSLILLSARTQSAGNTNAVEVFKRQYDLAGANPKVRQVTVFDDRHGVQLRTEDRLRLADVSKVVSFTDEQLFDRVLRRA